MRMPDITVMVKPASGLCNMHCKYCFYMDELGHRAERTLSCMSEVVMERVIMETLQFSENTCTYVFQGGEPTLAGLDFYRKITEQAIDYLKLGSYLCYEIGFDQKDEVIDIINKQQQYSKTYCKKDLGGNDRVIITQVN